MASRLGRVVSIMLDSAAFYTIFVLIFVIVFLTVRYAALIVSEAVSLLEHYMASSADLGC
jgi:hypothetical protein